MTKRNLTLGSASGKLGSVVYMRRRGQQIARLLVPAPHDPRTDLQCWQRAQFADYVASWRAVRPYVEDTWGGVSRYGSRENAYSRHNRGLFPAIPAYYSRAGQWFPPMGLVTYGALPISFSYRYGEFSPISGTQAVEGCYFMSCLNQRAPTTIEGLFSKLVASGTGVREGDIMHVLFYNWYTTWEFDNYFAEQETSPSVVHRSVRLSASDNTSIDQALEGFGFYTGLAPGGQTCFCIRQDTSFFPYELGDAWIKTAWCIWFERPSNPRHSRYTRSRWALDSTLASYLEQLQAGTRDYTNIINSYKTDQ